MPRHRLIAPTLTTALALLCSPAGDAKGPAPAPAADPGCIAAAGPDRRALCVVLGADPELPVLLARRTPWLIHVLVAGDADLAAARAAVAAAGVVGQVQVERALATPLPYAAATANVVVVAAPPNTAPGTAPGAPVSGEEIARITAPGGTVWRRTPTAWEHRPMPWPAGLAAWTHPVNGADGNRYSPDTRARFPAGSRWQDGIPMNFNMWAAHRGWVIAGGRCFSLGTTVAENLLPAPRQFAHDEWLVARDAFNGLPQWRAKIGTPNDGKALSAANVSPLATDGKSVFVGTAAGVIAFAADTGGERLKIPCDQPVARLLLVDGMVACAAWQERALAKDEEHARVNGLWAPWVADAGTVAVFDAATGTRRWTAPIAAQTILAAGGRLIALAQRDNPMTAQRLAAFSLGDGRPLWGIGHEAFAPELGAVLGLVTPERIALARPRANRLTVLDAATGAVAWETELKGAGPILARDDALLFGGGKFAATTGELLGRLARPVSFGMCTPPTAVGDQILFGRGGTVASESASGQEPAFTTGNRGGCIQGLTPAHGAFFTAQNYCRCSPAQLPGFLSVGPLEPALAPAPDQSAARVERGPAFGPAAAADLPARAWPLLRGNAQRSAATPDDLPERLALCWQTAPLAAPPAALAPVWAERLLPPLTPPTAAGTQVLIAQVNQGAVVALDAATGAPTWRLQTGSRIDSPPSLFGGLAVVGSHDGWVYACRRTDGAIAWRTRVAPGERRCVAFGAVESAWPVIGSVAVADGKLVASAGRSSATDGGLFFAALEPADGRALWRAVSPPELQRQNDLLRVEKGDGGDRLRLHHLGLEPATGQATLLPLPVDPKSKRPVGASLEGWIDGTWTKLTNRRSGRLAWDKLLAELLAWDDALIVGFDVGRGDCFAVAPQAVAAAADAADADVCWRFKVAPNELPQALLLGKNAVVIGGRTTGQGADNAGGGTGFLRIHARDSGRELCRLTLPSPPCYDGFAWANGRLYASLEDATVVCLGPPEAPAAK